MTNNELVAELAKRLNCAQPKVSKTLDSLVEIIAEALVEENSVKFSLLGTFDTTESNSITRQDSARIVTFQASHTLKGKLKNLLQ